jgi:hypothetical protein
LSVSNGDINGGQPGSGYQKQRVASQKKAHYGNQNQAQHQNSDNVRENRLITQTQQRVVRDMAGSVDGQGGTGMNASANLGYDLESTNHS